MNKQPFYHEMTILFTATEDVSVEASKAAFKKKLARFLREEISPAIITRTVALDGPCEADPGDPADLL